MQLDSRKTTAPAENKTAAPAAERRSSPLRGMSFADQESALMPPQGGGTSDKSGQPTPDKPTTQSAGPASEGLGQSPPPGVLLGSGLKVDPAAAKTHARHFISLGNRDESSLTDQVFYELFPWLTGTKLKAGGAEATAWLDVRKVAVRPVLAEPLPEKQKPAEEKNEAKKDDKTDGADHKKDAAPTPVIPDVKPGPESTLSDTVGKGGKNQAADVAWVTQKLSGYGIAVGSGEKLLGEAIKAYEGRALNRKDTAKSRVEPNDYVHHALIAGARPAPIAVADPASLVDGSSIPDVVALRKEVAAVRLLRDGIQTDQGEEGGAEVGTDANKRDQLVAQIAQLRGRIKGLNLVGVDPEEARAIRAWGYRQVNELSPYYSQGRNANILEASGSSRTCNLTSLAMTLEALGLSAASYTGDMALLEQIRSASTKEGGATKKELDEAWGQNKEKKGVGGLRMPDFLQLVAVAHEMEKGKTMMKALVAAWDSILSAETLRTYATKFGCNAWLRYGAGSEKGKSKAQMWQETFGAELDAGRQVIIMLPSHFMRLQAVTEEGLIVDDPATGTKKNKPMPFSEATTYKLVVLG